MASSKKTGLIILGYVRFALLFVTFIVTIFAFSTRVNENHFINFNASDIISEDIKKFVVETSAFEQANLERGSYTIRDIPSISKKVISFKEAKYAKNFADDLYGAGLASSLEKDVEVKAFTDFNDAKYSQQTNLTQMQMQIGWNNLSDANLVKIAIVDTGVRGNHEDLSGKVLAGYNVLTSSAISANSNSDDHGHGTAMASVAAASANNSVGIVGVSYTSSIIPVKTLNSAGNGLASDVALGVLWAADNSAKIVNLSLGSADYSQVLHDAIQYAVNRGCVVVAASGNDGGSVSYPGRDSLALAVGSVDSADNRSSFSNYGDELDVVAPGESIWHASSSSNSAYAQDTGTSISAAEVSGIMALSSIWYPTLTPAQLIEYICRSAAYVSGMGSGSFSAYYGYGRADYYRMQTVAGTYSAVWAGQSSYPTLADGQSTIMTISYLNTGSVAWVKGVVNLGLVDRNYNFLSTYQLASGWPTSDRPAILNEASVAPGAVGTFTFTVANNNLSEGNYRLDVGLVADGIAWFGHETHAYWDVNVSPRYSAAWVTQSSYPTLADGQSTDLTITYLNTGSATWAKGVVNLGTVYENYQWMVNPYAQGVNWPAGNRPAILNETSVAPGATGSFTFTVGNSGLPAGNYRLDVGLVADGIAWFGHETHAYWDVFAI